MGNGGCLLLEWGTRGLEDNEISVTARQIKSNLTLFACLLAVFFYAGKTLATKLALQHQRTTTDFTSNNSQAPFPVSLRVSELRQCQPWAFFASTR